MPGGWKDSLVKSRRWSCSGHVWEPVAVAAAHWQVPSRAFVQSTPSSASVSALFLQVALTMETHSYENLTILCVHGL